MRNLFELCEYKRQIVRELDAKIEKKKDELLKFIAKYFRIKYLSFIVGATCDVTSEELVQPICNGISNIFIRVNYNRSPVFSFGIYYGNTYVHTTPFQMRQFIKYVSDKKTFNIMRTDMKRIYKKYTRTSYLTILPLAVTLTLCNQHNRIFPKDIINIIIKKLFFKQKINLIFFYD